MLLGPGSEGVSSAAPVFLVSAPQSIVWGFHLKGRCRVRLSAGALFPGHQDIRLAESRRRISGSRLPHWGLSDATLGASCPYVIPLKLSNWAMLRFGWLHIRWTYNLRVERAKLTNQPFAGPSMTNEAPKLQGVLSVVID